MVVIQDTQWRNDKVKVSEKTKYSPINVMQPMGALWHVHVKDLALMWQPHTS